ncbi:hypothetical protein [Sphingobacterium sp. HMA12]|uniref:hypothetical protein n=1 Tax=Sphingobacterium sp. HMA12 TaxID=2050894 RepID=UPI000CE9B269|nr:hypothetical protein [Sphingobacterium sp. HMA12]
MEEVLKFVKEHQMLSGSIGIILVAIIGIFIKNKNNGASQKQKLGNNSKGYQAGRDIKINSK